MVKPSLTKTIMAICYLFKNDRKTHFKF